MNFKELGLSGQLLTVIDRLGFTEPTEIQEKSIPHIMKGEDVMGQSATGSGKTLAFGSGIIDKSVPGKGLQALVLTPTRELAEQVKGELIKLSYQKHLKIISIYGGVAIDPQIHGLTTADVVVATPGRLLDHLERGTIDTTNIRILVLDEADRMLDMGFIEDVERIMQACTARKQTLFFSATLVARIMDLAEQYLNNPVRVSAVDHVDPSKLKQIYYDISKNEKLSLLVHLLKHENSGLVMVFCNTRRTTDFVVKNLSANGIKVVSIHGGLSQNKRSRMMKMFDDGKVGVLVCTDVASRGLHIDNISHVYNYEIPKDSKDYVHRIGRTARAGEEGKAVNLLCDYDYENFSRIISDYGTFIIEKTEKPPLERIIVRRPDDDRSGSRSGFNRGPYRGPQRGPQRRREGNRRY